MERMQKERVKSVNATAVGVNKSDSKKGKEVKNKRV